MRTSKGAIARANKPEPLQQSGGHHSVGSREVRRVLPRAANRPGVRSIARIFEGRWPGHVGMAVRAAVTKRLQEDAEYNKRVASLAEQSKLEVV